jgi:antirestriction protein
MSDYKAWIGCLAAYNSGKLHGEWVDLIDIGDKDDLSEAISAILASSPEPNAEEWAVFDHEGFGSLTFGMYPNPYQLRELAQALEAVSDSEAFLAYVDNQGQDYALQDLAATVEEFTENYLGTHKKGDFAYEYTEQTVGREVWEWIERNGHIEWEDMEDDWSCDWLTIIETGGGEAFYFQAY